MFHWGGFVGFGGRPGPSATWTTAGLWGLVVRRGGRPGPSATWTTAGLWGLVVGLGGSPGPSAKAAEASDKSNRVTARIGFIIILLIGGECPGNSLDGSASGRGF